MKLATKLLSGAALAVALMNSANASLVDWSFSGTGVNLGNASATFTYDTATSSFSDIVIKTGGNYSANYIGKAIVIMGNSLQVDGGGYIFMAQTATADFSLTDQSVAYSLYKPTANGMVAANGTLTSVAHVDSTATAVPEPEVYAMMLAGLGLVGFVARRKQAV